MTSDTTATTYDYGIVKDVLTASEKERIVCVYLKSLDPNNIAWEAATSHFGSASVGAFRKDLSNIHTKLQNAAGKKRKSKWDVPPADQGEDGGDGATIIPAPKKRKSKWDVPPVPTPRRKTRWDVRRRSN